MTSAEGFLRTNGIDLTSFLHSFASITTNLAKTISGTTGTRLFLAVPVLECGGADKLGSEVWELLE